MDAEKRFALAIAGLRLTQSIEALEAFEGEAPAWYHPCLRDLRHTRAMINDWIARDRQEYPKDWQGSAQAPRPRTS